MASPSKTSGYVEEEVARAVEEEEHVSDGSSSESSEDVESDEGESDKASTRSQDVQEPINDNEGSPRDPSAGASGIVEVASGSADPPTYKVEDDIGFMAQLNAVMDDKAKMKQFMVKITDETKAAFQKFSYLKKFIQKQEKEDRKLKRDADKKEKADRERETKREEREATITLNIQCGEGTGTVPINIAGNATVAYLREAIQNACYKGMTKKSAKKMQIYIQGELNDLTLAPRKTVRGLGLRDGMVLVTKFGLTGGGVKKTIIKSKKTGALICESDTQNFQKCYDVSVKVAKMETVSIEELLGSISIEDLRAMKLYFESDKTKLEDKCYIVGSKFSPDIKALESLITKIENTIEHFKCLTFIKMMERYEQNGIIKKAEIVKDIDVFIKLAERTQMET